MECKTLTWQASSSILLLRGRIADFPSHSASQEGQKKNQKSSLRAAAVIDKTITRLARVAATRIWITGTVNGGLYLAKSIDSAGCHPRCKI
jgi:hypothetical protein